MFGPVCVSETLSISCPRMLDYCESGSECCQFNRLQMGLGAQA
ncbi:hypothetical protein M6B38_403475 [Iris pallida]|uniref:Uncharacterized protein n=1 Tax=Iris pallida TaxID=29817 RepID=A0AAX6FSA4_IRIPA|nr:hypothetical protein M6B38_403475 [Iris pallida]